MMQQDASHTFDEATLLAYVEQVMTAEERAAFESAVDARLLSSLRRMQVDCESLRSMPPEQPPASLVADVLAGVERSMLLETDLVAPPINMRRYRVSHWQRYAAAAGFFLLLTGGGFMLFQTLRFDSRDADFAPGSLVREAPDTDAASPDARSGDSSTELVAIEDPERAPATAQSGQIDSGVFEAAMAASVETELDTVIDRHRPVGFDLYANVITADPSAAFDKIASRLRSRGGDLIVNATLSVPAGVLGPAEDRERLARTDWRTPPGMVGPVPLPVAVGGGPPVSDPDDRVPLEEQSRYAARGYQFTLLGTPSDILGALRELGAERSLRIAWSRSGTGRLLVDLVAPNVPAETRWDHVMFWWVDPAARFDEARAAVAQASTEPFIRIPVRMLRSDGG